MSAPITDDGIPPGGRSSVWLVAQRTLTAQRRGRFVPESRQHPGRMSPDLAAEAIRRYTRPGDVVLDPMCGIGTTLVEAVHAGRDAIGIEYEPRWAHIARANLDLAATQGAVGRGCVITGNARDAGLLAGTIDGVTASQRDLLSTPARLMLTSPPYGTSTHGHVRMPAGPGPVVSHLHQRYSSNRRDRANLAHVDPPSLGRGFGEILTATVRLLAPDAVVAVTARPWRVDGLLVDLPGIVISAAEDAGLRLIDRCVALLASERGGRLKPRHSFHQLLQVRRARERGDDWLLIANEDVLVFLSSQGSPYSTNEERGPSR